MSTAYQIVVCAGIVPDLLKTVEIARFQLRIADCGYQIAYLKNEMMLPAVLDPWAS